MSASARPFPARYRGRCAAECGEPIEPDVDVVYVDDELTHARCAEADRKPPRPEPAPCPSCWLVHAGECA